MHKLKISLVILIILPLLGMGQIAKIHLDEVEEDGYYHVTLSSRLLEASKGNLKDIRVVDETGKEVPYFVQQEDYESSQSIATTCTILNQKQVKGCCSEYIFKNPLKKLSSVELTFKNADVQKNLVLMGSNDQESWFGLKDFSINMLSGTVRGTTVEHTLWFPKTDYTYLKLGVDDTTSLPIELDKISVKEALYFHNGVAKIEDVKIFLTDTLNKTIIDVTMNDTNLVEFIELDITGPKYYSRKGKVLRQDVRFIGKRKRKKEFFWNDLLWLDLRSDQSNFFSVNRVMPRHFKIEINNEDNVPLSIDAVKLMQRKRTLYTQLERGKTYFVESMVRNEKRPKYDLTRFQKEIVGDAKPIAINSIEVIVPEEVPQEDESFFKSNNWIWGIILLVMALLGGMSWKMLKEKNEQN